MLDVFYAGQSARALGAIVDMITPMPRAKRRMTTYEVPGRSGLLHIAETGFAPVARDLSLSVRSKAAMLAVNEWCVSSGEMVVTDEPGYFFRAYQHEKFAWEQQSARLYTVTIPFEVIPYWYIEAGLKPMHLTEPGRIFNAQDVESEPIITLFAQGNVTLYVGNYVVNLAALAGETTIDSEMQLVLRDKTSLSSQMRGDFPLLLPGWNEINWIGDVEKVTIIPRWRKL